MSKRLVLAIDRQGRWTIFPADQSIYIAHIFWLYFYKLNTFFLHL